MGKHSNAPNIHSELQFNPERWRYTLKTQLELISCFPVFFQHAVALSCPNFFPFNKSCNMQENFSRKRFRTRLRTILCLYSLSNWSNFLRRSNHHNQSCMWDRFISSSYQFSIKFQVITAAHCIFPEEEKQGLLVRVGHDTSSSAGVLHSVHKMHAHPGYNHADYKTNDLAIIELDTPIVLNEFTAAIPLIDMQLVAEDGPLAVVGFGLVNDEHTSELLQVSDDQVVVGHAECKASWFPNVVLDTHICTQSSASAPCLGDSGGPVVFAGHLVGVVSWGSVGCRVHPEPSVATNIFLFRDWILDTIKKICWECLFLLSSSHQKTVKSSCKIDLNCKWICWVKVH